jgi:hypothetical protein
MQVVITPYYKDLFPDDNDTLEELLEDIDSRQILQLVALMDAELYSRDEGQQTQLYLFNLFLGRQSEGLRAQIIQDAFRRFPPNRERHFFTRHYNLIFLHYVLLHFQEVGLEELSPAQDLKLFKAYFLVAEEFGQQPRPVEQPLPAFDEDYFAKMIWPTMADNMEINFRIHPYHIMVRGVVFLNYFQFHTDYAKYVVAYLKKHNKKTTLNYAFDIFQMLNANFESIRQNPDAFAAYSFGPATGFETFYEQFAIDPVAYQAKYRDKKENYAGIKARPLYQLNENNWLVLNWSFLANKLYEGLVFDFYQNSGIAAEPVFQQFTGFKQFIGENITEKHLLRSMAKKAWAKKYDVLLFDGNDQIDGFPDVYYRKGNTVFLIEIKDVYFASATVNSYAYDKIKETIDTKLNSAKRGSGQLIKQLKKLKNQAFEKPQRYKSPAHLTIYPIIIYTDIHFNMLGVNEYVDRSFSKMIVEAGLQVSFRKIKPLTMINLNYLISIFDLLESPATSLSVLIDHYHHQLYNRKKKHLRTKNWADHQLQYSAFETISSELADRDDFTPKYIKWITSALNLFEGLQPT